MWLQARRRIANGGLHRRTLKMLLKSVLDELIVATAGRRGSDTDALHERRRKVVRNLYALH